MSAAVLISHPSYSLHDMGSEQPECPARLQAITAELESTGLLQAMRSELAPAAEWQDLIRVHDEQHLEHLRSLGESGETHMIDFDTIMMQHSWQAALHAAGAGCRALELSESGAAQQAFCLSRPPGHHAERRRAMGFCFLNHIAVCAAKALDSYGMSRVAIVDFDVHHGNGTEDIFANEERVLFASSFQHPLYPGTPFATDKAHIVNMPMPAGIGSARYRQTLEQRLWPAIDAFQPQLILVSAGFDAHQADPLGGLGLLTEDYHWLGQHLQQLADQHCAGKLIAILEGGYNLPALAQSTCAFLLGARPGRAGVSPAV